MVSPDSRSGKLRTKEDYVAGIKQLQRYAGLKETGQLDADTLALIKTDRCGVADFSQSDNTKRRKRYTLQGSSWKKKVMFFNQRKINKISPISTEAKHLVWADNFLRV